MGAWHCAHAGVSSKILPLLNPSWQRTQLGLEEQGTGLAFSLLRESGPLGTEEKDAMGVPWPPQLGIGLERSW